MKTPTDLAMLDQVPENSLPGLPRELLGTPITPKGMETKQNRTWRFWPLRAGNWTIPLVPKGQGDEQYQREVPQKQYLEGGTVTAGVP